MSEKIFTNEFKPGTKVTYTGNPFKGPEHGIVKSHNDKFVFVVFNCGGDWLNYDQYTAAACRPEELADGWL